jgi:hypothetical protein
MGKACVEQKVSDIFVLAILAFLKQFLCSTPLVIVAIVVQKLQAHVE